MTERLDCHLVLLLCRTVYLFYDNNGSPFLKPVISPDSVCEVLKGGAVFYRHDPGRERYGKGAFTRRMLTGTGMSLGRGERLHVRREVYGLSARSAAGGS